MATKAFQKIYTKITQITKATCSLKATGVGYDELATVDGKLAQVVKIAGDDVTLQVFEGTEGIPTNAEVVFLGKSPTLKVSEQLAGRFFNAFGDPIDGGPDIEGQEVEIGGPSVNPVRRKQPSELIATGIAGIDLNNTLVSGQKIPFFADPDQPFNQVMANVALRAETDKIILGGMGMTNDDYLYFKNVFSNAGALDRIVSFMNTTENPPVERLLIPDMALTAAEYFAVNNNEKVLVLLTDMTSYADALAIVSNRMDQIPSKDSMPRTGDKVVLQTTINNLTPEEQQGEAYLELFVPSTNAVISKQQVTFNVKAQENQTVSFEFTAPENMDLLGCRIIASSSEFSDGEQHVLPVVSNATLVTQTLPIFTSQQGQQTFKLNAPKGVTPYRLTLELTANPIWYAVLALPTINTPQTDNVTEITASYYVSTLATAIANANPQITNTIRQWMQKSDATLTSPLEKTPELKSILLQLSPWVTEAQNETQQMHSLGELLDVNRQNYISQQAIDKLAELQNEDGGWSWFKGFNSSTFMTENVLEAMARLVSLNVTSHPEKVKKMQIKALQFLDKQIQESYKHVKTAGYSQILYLYTRSAYRDIPLTKALEAHKYYLGQLETSWPKLSLYEKALTAIAMERYGKTEIAKQIIRSLKEYSTTTPEMGMYWANNRSTLFTNSTIQTHVAIMSAFREIEGNSTDMELMKQWLLRQKQTQSWGSTPSTVDAIYALLLTGNNQLTSSEDLSVKLGNKNLNVSPEEKTLGYIKQTFMGKEITPKMMNVTLSKKQQQSSWGALYLQYFEKLDKITSHSGGISVKKNLFIQKEGDNGNTLTPLAGQDLQVGDRICIRITVTSDQDMQFVHLKDLRAGCFEPTEQLSGNRWQDNLGYYQETTDVATNFFFDFLPKGTHVFEYTVWIAQRGTYQDGIATLQCVYAPQYSANSDAGSLTVQ